MFKIISLTIAILATMSSSEEPVKANLYLKYNYLSAPKYSLDGTHYLRTRNEFAFRSFYPEFKQVYGNKFGNESLVKAESQHMWANIIGIPGGAILGLGLAQFISKGGSGRTGAILCLASAPILAASISFDIASFRTIRAGMKGGL